MVDLIEQHNELLRRSIDLLEAAKILVSSLKDVNNEKRVNTAIYDINRIIEYANQYLQNNNLYSPNTFRYDSSLIHLTDTIRYNDFGTILSENQSKEKESICLELIEIVNQLIIANDTLKQINK
ncbi:MAG: hypothetical protein JST26_19155 [Bacteroidetes bacterium]|nr:hypothetical protein [Bacteroidota bacterium]